MSEKNQVIFKTVFMGFEKEAVLNYIDQLCTMFHTENEKQAEELDDVKQENERLRDQVEQLNGQLAEQENLLQRQEEQLRSQAESLRRQQQQQEERPAVKEEPKDNVLVETERENTQLKAQLKALTKDLEKARQMLGQKEDALTYLRSQSEQVLSHQKELTEKGKKYDIISANVGSIVLEAEHTANQIVKGANEEAERIRSEANAAANEMGEHLREFRREMDRMQGAVVTTFKNLKDNFAGMARTLDDSERFLFPPKEEPEIEAAPETVAEANEEPKNEQD